jgi:hypothetical protein
MSRRAVARCAVCPDVEAPELFGGFEADRSGTPDAKGVLGQEAAENPPLNSTRWSVPCGPRSSSGIRYGGTDQLLIDRLHRDGPRGLRRLAPARPSALVGQLHNQAMQQDVFLLAREDQRSDSSGAVIQFHPGLRVFIYEGRSGRTRPTWLPHRYGSSWRGTTERSGPRSVARSRRRVGAGFRRTETDDALAESAPARSDLAELHLHVARVVVLERAGRKVLR